MATTSFAHHPLWVAGRAALDPGGPLEAARGQMTEILEAANEDPDGFRVTSRSVVAGARWYG